MIDFIKIPITDVDIIRALENNHRLIWINDVDTLGYDNETITSKRNKAFEGILFTFYDYKDYAEIRLRPHYWRNDNKHNADTFTAQDCIITLMRLPAILDVDISECRINNIEFGLNILSPICIKDLITWIKYHRKNEFIHLNGLQFCKISATSKDNGKYSTYKQIKAYAKGLQYPQYTNINTFRFEVKSKQSKYLNSLGIYKFKDLLNIDTYRTLGEVIKKEFEHILIMDNTDLDGLSKSEKARLNKYLNPDVWYKYTNGHRNQFNRHKKNYNRLVSKAPNNLKNQLKNVLEFEIDKLLMGAISTPPTITNKGAISTVYKCGIRTSLKDTDNRICKVTGLSIDMQKEGSKLLSHTGLYYYCKNDIEVFTQLRRRFLTNYWNTDDKSTVVKEIAHNIRNYYYNRKGKQKRIYGNSSQTLLFQ